MRKGLFCAVLLITGLAACSRGGGNGSDDDRLNAAAAQQDNAIYDTSADDAALNQAELPTEEGAPANGAAPGNVAANAAAPGNSTGNAQ